MKATLRKTYQTIVPFRTREKLFKMRSKLSRLLSPADPSHKTTHVQTIAQPWIVPEPSTPLSRNIPASILPVMDELRPLPGYWHEAGTLSIGVLEAIVHYLGMMSWPIANSMETGCGKSTVVLSHISANHKVFTLTKADNSFATAMGFPYTRQEVLEVIEGPTQLTLPAYKFSHNLQFALIDGPHGYPFPDIEYYHIYPHLAEGALLVIDDIHIPNIKNMFDFLCSEEMFILVEVVNTTAIFRR